MKKKQKYFNLTDGAVEIDLTKPIDHAMIYRKHGNSKDAFFAAISHYASSTEMMTTWIGREPKDGGMVVIPWNTLVALVNCLLAEGEENRKNKFSRFFSKKLHREREKEKM